jgi:hypothetical protein
VAIGLHQPDAGALHAPEPKRVNEAGEQLCRNASANRRRVTSARCRDEEDLVQ